MSGRDRYTIREEAYKRKYVPYDGDEYKDPSCRTIDIFNSNLWTWRYNFEKNPKNGIENLLEITKNLGSILTNISDESLFEIDDVLYADYKVSEFKENSFSSKSKYLDCLAMEDYNMCYTMILDMGYSNHELDTFYLRLAENLGGIHFDWIFGELGKSRDERKICLFLKIFKSCLKVNDKTALFIIKDFADELGFPFFLLKLQQFPQPSDSKNKKIVEFIKKQAGDCLGILNEEEILKGPKKFIEDSILYFVTNEYEWSSHYQYILLDVFMMAKNNNERKEFLREFLKALHRSCSKEKRSIYHEFRMTFVNITKNLISIAQNIVRIKCCEEDMRYIDQHCGYNIGTYWSDKSTEDAKAHHKYEIAYVDEEEICQSPSMDEEEICQSPSMIPGIQEFFENCNCYEHSKYHGYAEKPRDIRKSPRKSFHKSDVYSFKEDSDIDSQKHHSVRYYFENLKAENIKDLKDEYIFKKFLIYDDFMKCLHLMSILHTAITEYEALFKDEPKLFIKSDDPCINSTICLMYLRNELCSNLSNKEVSWPLEMAVTKCAFLYLRQNVCHLNMEYLKDLKGEQIDEDTEKKLFGCNRKEESAWLRTCCCSSAN